MTALLPLLRRPLAAVALLLAAALPAGAVELDDLLPVDDAFALSAQALGRDRIALTWRIADGYYLYRHRIDVQPVDAGFARKQLALPTGARHTDEFFGEVETYRGALTATLHGAASADAETVALKVKYQGCADLGICYPPQTRTVHVALPADAASAPAGSDDLAALGRSLGGGRKPLFGAAPGGASDAPPLPPEQAFAIEAIAGDGNTLLLRLTPAPGYYLYRDKTTLKLDGGAGIALGAPRWPPGTAHRDEHFGEVVVYFDQAEVPVPVQRTHANPVEATLTIGFQGCQTDGICYPPMTRTLPVALPAGTLTPAVTPIATTTTVAQPPPASVVSAAATADAPLATAAPAVAAATSPPAGLTGAPRGSRLGLASALLLALFGGLILNLMPCVLPVLSLKALSLAGSGESSARARRHALWYSAGVLLSFVALGALALALRQAGAVLGWGFQLQQPLVVALLALLMFALGLSLSGVWQAGGPWVGAGEGLTRRAGPAGDFFTGVLAVVVATPCTAPFMGAALAWAFTAPTLNALLVFLALGLGMALPFLLIGFVPALAQRLPRPGPWMETLKQVLAFPLYLTAAWLAWGLARQRGADAIGWWLLAAIVLAFALWAWTHGRMRGRRWALVAAAVAMLALLWPLRAIQALPRPATALSVERAVGRLQAVPFSEQRLSALRAGGRVVFVNMTADWCVSCKANERAVFRGDGFRSALEASDAVYMVGDWTDVDPAITAFLQRYQAVGVPLYVVYPRGGGDGRVLPTILTPDIAREALAAAASPAP